MSDIYEVWTSSYDTLNETDWVLTYRFSDAMVARKMADLLGEGWGNRAEVRYDPQPPPVLDATVEDVEAWWKSNRYDPFPGMEDDD